MRCVCAFHAVRMGVFCGWFGCTYLIICLYIGIFVGGLSVRTVTMLHVKVVRMVVIRLYVRHGNLVLGVIRPKLCNGRVIIVGVCIKLSAIHMDINGINTELMYCDFHHQNPRNCAGSSFFYFFLLFFQF